MFRLESVTTNAVALSLTLAVLWGLMGCASLCSLEDSLHGSELSVAATISDDRIDRIDSLEPIEDCCLCPDISSPAGTTQQRETGEQIVSLVSAAPCPVFNTEPALILSYRIRRIVDDSPPKINAPPLFLRLRNFRI